MWWKPLAHPSQALGVCTLTSLALRLEWDGGGRASLARLGPLFPIFGTAWSMQTCLKKFRLFDHSANVSLQKRHFAPGNSQALKKEKNKREEKDASYQSIMKWIELEFLFIGWLKINVLLCPSTRPQVSCWTPCADGSWLGLFLAWLPTTWYPLDDFSLFLLVE